MSKQTRTFEYTSCLSNPLHRSILKGQCNFVVFLWLYMIMRFFAASLCPGLVSHYAGNRPVIAPCETH